VGRCRKHIIVIGKPGLTAYSKIIRNLAETLKLFVTDDKLNEICRLTNAECSYRVSKVLKDISSEELFAFFGFYIIFGVLTIRNEPATKLWSTNTAYARPFFRAKIEKELSSFSSMTKL
jgi:hypothetical protein